MLKKLFKASCGIFLAMFIILSTGCTFFTQMSRDSLSEYVVEAVVQGDKDALWDVLSPNAQDQFLAGAYNDEEKAKEQLLQLVKIVSLKVHGIDPAKLAESPELQKELAEKLAADENFFVKQNWIWYIGN